MAQKTVIEAIREGMDEEMARDPSVFLIGEDVGQRGGVFLASDGLYKKYGEYRVIDSPLAESCVVGVAIGAAVNGMRPIAEIQFADFIAPAMNQIIEEAARFCYRTAGDFNLPMVIRAPWGGGVHGALYHSQSIEATFAHIPGLKVVAPGTPADAISAEVLDLRTIKPIDEAAIVATAKKTGKVLVVHEDTRFAGIAAEVMAIIMEHAFDALDAPLMRLTAPDVPAMPFNHVLEEAFMPNVDRILAKAKELAAY